MSNPKGNPATLRPGQGRRKGSKNKATLRREDILKHFLGALDEFGADKAFKEWIEDRRGRRDYLKEAVGLIPKEDKVQHSGNVTFEVVSWKSGIAEQEQVKKK